MVHCLIMVNWNFLTSHARVLMCIAHDPGARLRDIAARLGITERSAHGIITGLTAAGYVIKQKDGRRNRYQIQAHLPLPEAASQEPAIGEVLAVLAGRPRLSPGRFFTPRTLVEPWPTASAWPA
jgi:hypothetical protein